jgi:geranylgeranyl diphosphate synthase type I
MQNAVSKFYQIVSQEIDQSIKANATGLLVEMANHHFSFPGKMLRPRLAFELGSLLGLNAERMVHWAAALEMLHNATLIHDDLQDGDHYRRGQPTIWNRYGAAQAINLGDFLMLLAPAIILRSDFDLKKKSSLSLLYSNMATKIVNGQSAEPTLKTLLSSPDLESEYLTCVSQKTSALFAGVAEGVCIIGDLNDLERKATSEVFSEMGDLFQIQDDVLDLYGNKQRDIVGSDIKEGKVSFLIVQHLSHFPDDALRIREILEKPRDLTTDDEVQFLIRLFKESGTLARVLASLLKRKQTICSQAPTSIQSFVFWGD